jgi:outer membrane protein assembly factor BamB
MTRFSAILTRVVALQLVLPCCVAEHTWAADRPQWGQRYCRNMVSEETGLPARFDPLTGENIKWSVSLGSNAYGSPVIAGGKVLIGANNAEPRDPRHRGDRGVLLCLNEDDGSLCWQLVVPRIGGDIYKDWPEISMCSPPTVEGDRVYTLTNRFEVVCLDLDGQADGNDGPYQDEGRHMAPSDTPAMEVTPIDADIIWLRDMPGEFGTYPHDSAHSSILLDGQYLYLNTCNGVDNTHRRIRCPDAPSLIVLDKLTGRLVAQDGEHVGPRIFHSTWSSPALGEVGGQRLVFFGGGDGVCYAFAALQPSAGLGPVQQLHRVWRFDCDPTAPKEDVHRYHRNRRESPSNIKSMPVFHNGRLYVTVGGDIWWGKEQAWLKCIDATQTGEITETGQLWSYPLELHCCATPSIHNGLVFVADCGGKLHCVDAETGKPYWTHQLRREVWGSTLVADGKVYVGSRAGDFWILAAEKKKRVLGSVQLGASMATTPVAANGVLYVASLERLYAIAQARGDGR